ncbi:MAG: 6-carboxytetrahydropterin synthase [Bdellovibrionota bacterium]
MFKARLCTKFHFESAHFMPNYPEGHPNRAFHGHSFTGEVVIEAPVDLSTGMVMEHETLDRRVKEIVGLLDHRLLNDVPGLELPTSEFITKWIFERLKPNVRGLKEVSLARETVGIKVTYSEEMQ